MEMIFLKIGQCSAKRIISVASVWDNSLLSSNKIILDFRNRKNEYMQLMDFQGLALDDAFRLVCKQLYLQAESQVIDGILVAFSKRYYDQNRADQEVASHFEVAISVC